MARDISLMITAKDNYSSAISKMATTTRSFEKDMAGLSSKLDQLNRNKVSLQVDMASAKRELTDAKKKFLDTGDAIDQMNMTARQGDLNQVASNLKLVGDQARQTERDMQGLTDEMSKQQNRSGRGARGGEGELGLSGKLAASGASKMVGDLASHAANAFVGSAFGSEAGTVFSSALSSAGSGAAIGTMIAPGIGTAIGALGGAVVGLVDGAVTVAEEKDANFKNVVQERYAEAQEKIATSLADGITTAASREMSMISWTTLLGDKGQAKSFLGDVVDMAAKTPYEYDQLENIAKIIKVYGYETEQILPMLTAVGDAGAAMGLSTDSIEQVATALGRMNSTDKSNLKYINMLTERGIGAIDWLAERDQISVGDVYDKISKGDYSGRETAEFIMSKMADMYGGSMDMQSMTFSGLESTLADANIELNNAMGKAFTETRKTGLEEQIAFLDGESGAKMQEAYGLMGQWQASLENSKDQFQRDAMTAVMDGALGSFEGTEVAGRLSEMAEQYQALLLESQAGNEEAGAQMGALLAEAQVIANNEYLASDGYQLELEAQMGLISNIRNDTALSGSYYDAGYQLGQEFSKGRSAAALNSDWAQVTLNPRAQPGKRGGANRNAWGQTRVPYDGYLAELHEGETIRTARESRNDAAAPGGGVVVQVAELVVREQADVYLIAQQLAREIELARSVAI